jgi:hypothetical protein
VRVMFALPLQVDIIEEELSREHRGSEK